MARLLSPEDVLNATFTQSQFREGYDEREVDEFLDDVVAALRHHAEGGSASAPLSADRVATTRFSVTKFRRGYDQHEIDALLGDIEYTLRTFEEGGTVAGGARRPAPVPTPAPVPSSSSPGSRLLKFLRGDKG